MFKRKQPRSLLAQGKEFFWPSMGFVRTFKYIKHRIIRMADTSHKIAAGLACGAAISFTPLVGTHFIQAGLAAYAIRANLLASLIGTFVGNPWTFPFMWWASISFGSFLFGLFGLPASTALPETLNFHILWDIALHHPMRIFLPWLAGGYLLGLLSWPISYFIFYQMVKGAKLARRKALVRKLNKVAKGLTEQKSQ